MDAPILASLQGRAFRAAVTVLSLAAGGHERPRQPGVGGAHRRQLMDAANARFTMKSLRRVRALQSMDIRFHNEADPSALRQPAYRQ